ncbi:UNVERIFIED_CONTAM: hypothetical protein Sradi_0688100 [Sesamum radiatum]|uniref:Retrotransposon gag domain-containing protein n=1 Tax=Sesamum radiatum TaxID=300843 RepID=A0AAW2VQB3_SESRA
MSSSEASSQQNNHVGASRDDGSALPLKFALKLGAKQKAQVVEKDLLNDSMIHSSSTSSKAEIATVMMVQTTSLEEKITSLTAVVENLLKHVQARDDQLNKLHKNFIETCNNARTDRDLLVKQFVLSLKDTAFDWYIDLEANSIDSWGDLQNKFFNRFYSARRTVSMIELANQHQGKDELVLDYINNWRNLSLNCKDTLSEISVVELCIQGMH